jgi:CHAD domain-containing protein/transposase-like protein
MGDLIANSDRDQIEGLATRGALPRIRRRAQLILLYDDGLQTKDVAERVGLSRSRTRYWRRQYQSKGVGIFPEVAQRGEAGIEEAGQPLEEEISPVPEDQEVQPAVKGRQASQEAQALAALLTLESPGVEPDDPIAEAGRKVLRYHFAEMLRHEEGTRQGDDIEELHDMRVATRRMRAAFDVFEQAFKSKAIQAHRKGLKEAGRALGNVRDLDVFMEKAQMYLDTLPEDHHQGLEPLLSAWKEQREAGRAEMLAHLDGEKYQNFKITFLKFLNTRGAGAQPVPKDKPAPDLVRHIAPVLIYTQLANVRAFSSILNTASIDQLHALRIEFKRLRYTVEFFREVLGESAKEVIKDIKELQDHLGDLNDARVACEILREFLDNLEDRQLNLPVSERKNPEPIVAYLAAKHAERHNLMISFPQAWTHFERPEFRHNLAMAIAAL